MQKLLEIVYLILGRCSRDRVWCGKCIFSLKSFSLLLGIHRTKWRYSNDNQGRNKSLFSIMDLLIYKYNLFWQDVSVDSMIFRRTLRPMILLFFNRRTTRFSICDVIGLSKKEKRNRKLMMMLKSSFILCKLGCLYDKSLS